MPTSNDAFGRRNARFAGLGIIACLVTGGCRTAPSDGPDDEPVAADLIASHNARIGRIDQIESTGQLDLTWVDDDGEHFEFVNIHLLVDRPRHTSLRVEKLEDWMWLGSDDERYWFFDMRNQDDKILYLGRFDDMRIEREIPGLPHPLRLLDLAGLTPLPADARTMFDEAQQRWAIEGLGQGGVMRLYFDEGAPGPNRIESFSLQGELLFASQLRRYAPLELQGQPPGAYPYFPRQIEISAGDDEGSAKLTFDQPSGIADPSRLQRAFDLEFLRQRFQPDRVEELAEEVE